MSQNLKWFLLEEYFPYKWSWFRSLSRARKKSAQLGWCSAVFHWALLDEWNIPKVDSCSSNWLVSPACRESSAWSRKSPKNEILLCVMVQNALEWGWSYALVRTVRNPYKGYIKKAALLCGWFSQPLPAREWILGIFESQDPSMWHFLQKDGYQKKIEKMQPDLRADVTWPQGLSLTHMVFTNSLWYIKSPKITNKTMRDICSDKFDLPT